jgi:hypothetical protein
MTFSLQEEKVRDLLKEVMLELMAERPEIFHDIIVEAIEDAGLMAAIAEGESSETISRSEFDAILEERD